MKKSNLSLMVVDDSNFIRGKISRCELDNITVIATARNGKEAIYMYEEKRPDIVTMDLTMPEMDGIQSIKKLMLIDPDAHIIVISALSDMATAIEAIKCGAQGFLTKPFTDDELKESLEELMS